MEQDKKKQVSGEIPFDFLNEMGHSTRADITAHYTHRTLEVLRSGIQRLP